MRNFRADLHIHTVLSPCGSLDMSPINIVNQAKNKRLHIIGITDHNATQNAYVTQKIGESEGVFVLLGVEVCTKEEIHCLAFFENNSELINFQKYIDKHLPEIPNDVDKLGYQLIVDENEDIIDQLPYTLLSGINQSIDEVKNEVVKNNGIFIPAHIDRATFSISSQLGFIPPSLKPHAFEVSKYSSRPLILKQFPYIKEYNIIQDSDAHFIDDIGCVCNLFEMEELNFQNIKKEITKKYT